MPTKSPKPAHHYAEAPEAQCTITKVTGADCEGRPVFGTTYEEACSILKLPGDNTDISAKFGSSPDRPSASPRRDDAVLLLRVTTRIDVDDIIEVAGIRLKAYAIWPTYDSVGKLAHHVVQATLCD
jgi:hypothetical protein